MDEAANLGGARFFQQRGGADDVGLDERGGAEDRTVDVALGGEVDDGLDGVLGEHFGYEVTVADIAPDKSRSRRAVAGEIERLQIAGIGQRVEHDQTIARMGRSPLPYEVAADEAGAPGDQEIHGRGLYRRWGILPRVSRTIGSILHGAYGDYYEQLLCLKQYKRRHPEDRLVLIFESPGRLKELRVFDLAFADEVHSAADLPSLAPEIDRFVQYQVKDAELRANLLTPNQALFHGKLDWETNHKPWTTMRTIDFRDPANDVGLSDEGRARLPECMRDNGISDALLAGPTVGFLWRYRAPGPDAAVSSALLPSEDEVRQSKSELLRRLAEEHGAHALICGMSVKVTDENRARVDNKFSDRRLDVDAAQATYLRGLSWGLELEILRRCSICIVMPSGFSEALWIKRTHSRRRADVCLVDAPPHYLAKLAWNRMGLFDLFDLRSPRKFYFVLRQPHTAERVMGELEARGMLPLPRA